MLLRHFKAYEFSNYEEIDEQFLLFLDEVRHWSAIPFHITSSARSGEENKKVGGSATSLHLFTSTHKASAVDFTTMAGMRRDKIQWRIDLYNIVEAIIYTRGDLCTKRAVQLELVQGPSDWHIHLGLQPEDSPIKDKIILEIE